MKPPASFLLLCVGSYYDQHITGGHLHIVLDDGNVEAPS